MARNRRSGEPLLSLVGSWAVLGASFALSADTWILLAELAGFNRKLSIPNTDVVLAMSWLMPICVDGYVVVALTLWMSPVPAKVARFAKFNTYIAAGIGIAAQSLYHLLTTMATATEDWQIFLAAIVGAFPPALAGLSIHMRALIRRESNRTGNETPPAPSRVAGLVSMIGQVRQAMATPITAPVPTTVPVPATVPAPTMVLSTTAPSAPVDAPSTVDNVLAAPASTPGPAPAIASIPSPTEVADRITARTDPAPQPGTAARPARPRYSPPKTQATPLAPSSTDPQVTATEAVQLALPMVSPAKLQQAREVAQQYRTEHGTPITPGQLAVRVRVPTEQAAQLLASFQDSPASDPSVNGRPVKATR